ncbi:MAG: von Willebrand factor type A domain-containing protein [Flavobacterium sp.]|uniref:vWA domain-containing protein n=1 Tax=Flavobacterium sp. TaxID=239 RepID=UPI00326438A8
MKNLKSISLGIAMLISVLTFGQQKTITGTVTDASGPIPGVNVVVKGTQRGVTTNFDGTYKILAGTGETLVFSFMGMNDEIRIVGTSNIINIKMKESAKMLESVVVTGYSSDYEYEERPISPRRERKKGENIQALSGKVSGLQINTNTNANTRIVLRGNRSVSDKKDDLKQYSNTNINKTPIPNDEDYGIFLENEFESPKQAPLSTFSIDVDNASYTNIRRFINNGQQVPKDAVRIEEMMNFFKYNYPQPKGEHPFSINIEYSECPWNINNKLVRIGLQGKNIETDNLPASNLVFLIDVSGSMSDENKLPLLKQSLKILVNQLRNEDKISIVVYAGAAGLVLPPTSGNNKETIIAALENLSAGGSTAGGAGIQLAYKTAEDNFIKGGNNRVILATDGDFNVGASSDNDMQRMIEDKRKSGVFLTCLGYGMGNYKDSKMETLADKGNGNYAYIDNIQEANRFLGKEFKGSMFAIAKDVKIQIEFNPKYVQSYRLIGYENRKLRPEDFKNDAIDAGELGSNHTVTALYEIIPTDVKSDFFKETSDLKYTKVAPTENNFNDELATIKFRYKKPDGDKSIEMVQIIENKSSLLENASDDLKFTASVAWFGLKLRDSKLIKNKTTKDILALAKQGLINDNEGYRAEFIRLIENVRL